ncbi:MAG TPA: helix-turn-helix domain-containing protein [Acetomicrobium sp.]|nr:helix-turn-helix domain-containing protein [Acetomicrobium sp.]
MNMQWLTPEEVSVEWGIKARRVQALCLKGQIPNAVRKGRMWLIPKGTSKPIDGRTRAAKQLNGRVDNTINAEEK